MVEQRLIHCRHAGHRSGAGSGERLEALAGIEARQHGNAAAIEHGAVEHAGIGENMEERQHADNHVALVLVRIDRDDLAGIGGEVLMGEHRTLGRAGGAAGVLDQREIVFRIDGDRRGRPVTDQHGAPRFHVRLFRHRHDLAEPGHAHRQALPPRQHVGETCHDQRFKRRSLQHFERRRQEGGHIDRDQQTHSGIGDLRGEFGDAVERGKVDHGGTSQHRAEIGREVDRHVGQVEPDAFAFGIAHGLQAGGKAARFGHGLCVSGGSALEVAQRPVRPCCDAGREQVGHGKRRELLVPRAWMRIVLAPGLGSFTYSHVS